MGQAPDGGLLLPQTIPDVRDRLEEWRDLPFGQLAFEVIRLFATDIEDDALRHLVDESFATFDHEDVTPLVRFDGLNVLELFHGPTLAFKDVALQLLGRLFEHILEERGGRLNILGATSGDTGSAAIAGVRGRDNISIFVLFPNGKTSLLQELQMTTVPDTNVHCLAIDGSFDDCQRMMKSTFNDLEFKQRLNLAAVNSVNWARLMTQIVYYVFAAVRFDTPISFSVPTGNFGNIFAGYMARRMGVPIDRLILATNENDILARFFQTGSYIRSEVHHTISPSMDIQVASNFERFLYLRMDKDPDRLKAFMELFAAKGRADLGNQGSVDPCVVPVRVDTAATIAAIKGTYERFGYVVDPHTAVGVSAAASCGVQTPIVTLATAHPAKFPESVNEAIGKDVAHHPALDDLQSQPARKTVLPADQAAVQDYLSTHAA